ncbi:MAG: AAA family ATPase, partial [Coriobacteriia bacterium]|nr:AAA family ATPase [Coriobacteriia bacterium]
MGLVLITDADVEFCTRAREAIGGACGDSVEDVRTIEDAAVLASLRSPDLLVIGPSVDTAEALAFAESVDQAHPSCVTVVVARKVTTELMRVAMRVGVRDVVPASATSEIAESLRAAAEAAAKAMEPATLVEARPALGRVVTFFSTKGGVGKSFLASNVAVALAESGAKTVLIDLDLQFGDAGVLLDLTPERTIYDAVQCFDRLDADMLGGFLTEHKSGVQVLLAPIHPEDAEAITVSRLGVILSLLR